MNDFLKNLINSNNPQQIIQNMVNSNPNNKELIGIVNNMTIGKNEEDIKNIVKNICKERNIDFFEIERMINDKNR